MGTYFRLAVHVNLRTDTPPEVLQYLSAFNQPWVRGEWFEIAPIHGFQPFCNPRYYIHPPSRPSLLVDVAYWPSWHSASFHQLEDTTYQLDLTVASKYCDEWGLLALLEWLSPHFSLNNPRYIALCNYEDDCQPTIYQWHDATLTIHTLALPEIEVEFEDEDLHLPRSSADINTLVTDNLDKLVPLEPDYSEAHD